MPTIDALPYESRSTWYNLAKMIVRAEEDPSARGALEFRTTNLDVLENRDAIRALFPDDDIAIIGPMEGFRRGMDIITE